MNASVYPTTSSLSRMTTSSASLSEQIAAMRSASSCPRLSSRLQSRSSLSPPYHASPVEPFRLDQLTHGIWHEVADRAARGHPFADHRGGDVHLRHLDAIDIGVGQHVRRDAGPARHGDPRE